MVEDLDALRKRLREAEAQLEGERLKRLRSGYDIPLAEIVEGQQALNIEWLKVLADERERNQKLGEIAAVAREYAGHGCGTRAHDELRADLLRLLAEWDDFIENYWANRGAE